MNKKDFAELKRRFSANHHNITRLYGCYVNNKGEKIASFEREMAQMTTEEMEKYMAIFRHTLSGELEQNLVPIEFTPEQVMNSSEHRLLSELRASALKADDAVEECCMKICDALAQEPASEDNHLILLLHDGYDLPSRDGKESSEVFHYILCSVCGVKRGKPSLVWDGDDSLFHNRDGAWAVGNPEMGFLFPAFEERAANIYSAIYFTRDIAQGHDAFVTAMFGTQPPEPVAVQKDNFNQLLQETLGDECRYEVLQTVQSQVMDKLEEQKTEKKNAVEPPRIDKQEVKAMLEECGVTAERQQAFEQRFDEQYGQAASLNAVNVVSPKQFQLKTPNVVIRVSPDRSDLVETRVIDGHPYILIRAEEGVEVNGVNVNI